MQSNYDLDRQVVPELARIADKASKKLMLQYFTTHDSAVAYAVVSDSVSAADAAERLRWLFDGAEPISEESLKGTFIGPRKEMISPWSTNAVEITQNMGLTGISRIEMFRRVPDGEEPAFDPMLERVYVNPAVDVFDSMQQPAPMVEIDDIDAFNAEEGLALSDQEVAYLKELSQKLGRKLTDSEVFGFSQVNSEHCRHKIFNGVFVIDGKEMPQSLFKLIKRTSACHPRRLVSAYKDNVAFVEGPRICQFAPLKGDGPSLFAETPTDTVLSLKAETHNFPTTVEPFNGAATGSGGEIRDRLGGGRASLPLAGTAVYMTSYPRLRPQSELLWEKAVQERRWLYQTPADILVKASNGASDFGNKFGQPLICGSLLTFEHGEDDKVFGFDKVIMLAGGIGFARSRDAIKGEPEPGQTVMLAGGDNYRIGMGGGAVSSVDTGRYAGAIELNAVQRANPEMQKRVANLVRALAESKNNPIISIHDHGAGGHLNALSELIESTGGEIDIDALPVGDPTLSQKEIIGNESQERMGFVINDSDRELVERIADRERAPLFAVGHTTGDKRLLFTRREGKAAIDLAVADMLGNPPKTIVTDSTAERRLAPVETDESMIPSYIEAVLSLEAVGSKDWLTNKVDRSVGGRTVQQQCVGELQLPLADCGVVALDYHGHSGMATSIGHAPQAALADVAAGSRLAIAEALTNLSGANLAGGLDAVSLSANWMWPCHNAGEDAALYSAVKAASDFACAIGVNIPTGKDSLSMTQKYPDGSRVLAPGTVIISAAGEVADIKRTVGPVADNNQESGFYYIDFSSAPMELGGSALAQTLCRVGDITPDVADTDAFVKAFGAVQQLVAEGMLCAAHDVSAGGLVTTLLEMCFANTRGGINFYTDGFKMYGEDNLVKILFAENPAMVVQVPDNFKEKAEAVLDNAGVRYFPIGAPSAENVLGISHQGKEFFVSVPAMRKVWAQVSASFEPRQTAKECADKRRDNLGLQPLHFAMPEGFEGTFASMGLEESRKERSGIVAAIIREKGINGDREMAYSLYAAGFDVRDVHMTDLASGRETLDDVSMIVFCGGFSNSDVLGSAKGWAGGFLWNDNARRALERFYSRPDTLSLGVCNGCQLMMELNLLGKPFDTPRVKMLHNVSGKFESAFVGVTIPENPSVMFGPLAGTEAGIWVAHGEGRFSFTTDSRPEAALRYSYNEYPGNPNGSPEGLAGLCSPDGRHLAIMPHLERAIFPWQWAWGENTAGKEATIWLQAFVNARRWIENNKL